MTAGSVATGHPLATKAAVEVLRAGGNAVDAAVAAHAVLAVVLPDAGGLGGDAIFLVSAREGSVAAISGTGRAPRKLEAGRVEPGATVTVPGALLAWSDCHARFGEADWTDVMAPASRVARDGFRADSRLVDLIAKHRARLQEGGAAAWPLMAALPGETVRLEKLTHAFEMIAAEGPRALYDGPIGSAITSACRRHGGSLERQDLQMHQSVLDVSIDVEWDGGRVSLPPPASQACLLIPVLHALSTRYGAVDLGLLDHVCIELTGNAFAQRDYVGTADLSWASLPDVDLNVASRRAGPRAYCHTVAVATSDADGLVVSSLLSIFDDFGSAVYVPEWEFVLNNRAAGFTQPPNDAQGGKIPVSTLAPIILRDDTRTIAVATPGGDGQIQTLLQLLVDCRYKGMGMPEAIATSRWRSEDGYLLISSQHPSVSALRDLGHDLRIISDADPRFGAIVACYVGADGVTGAYSDWRRQVTATA